MITFILQQFNKNTLSIIFINGKYALNMPVQVILCKQNLQTKHNYTGTKTYSEGW